MYFFQPQKTFTYLLLGIAVIAWNLSCIGHEFYSIISDLNSSVTYLLCLFCLILKTNLQQFKIQSAIAHCIWYQINALFGVNKSTYHISSYSFRGNYSFLDLEIQRSQYIRPKVTVHRCAETIQGRKLYEEIQYLKFYKS